MFLDIRRKMKAKKAVKNGRIRSSSAVSEQLMDKSLVTSMEALDVNNGERNDESLESLSPPKAKKKRRNSYRKCRLPSLLRVPQTTDDSNDSSDQTVVTTGNNKLPAMPPLKRLYQIDLAANDVSDSSKSITIVSTDNNTSVKSIPVKQRTKQTNSSKCSSNDDKRSNVMVDNLVNQIDDNSSQKSNENELNEPLNLSKQCTRDKNDLIVTHSETILSDKSTAGESNVLYVEEKSVKTVTNNSTDAVVNNTSRTQLNATEQTPNTTKTTQISCDSTNIIDLSKTVTSQTIVSAETRTANDTNSDLAVNDATNTGINELSNNDINLLIPHLNEIAKTLDLSQINECANSINVDNDGVYPSMPINMQLPVNNNINDVLKQPESTGIANYHKATRKKHKLPKVVTFRRPTYCVRMFRKVIHTRHSTRLKNSGNANNESSGDINSNDIENANWDEIDGTRYECTVSKSDVDEEERKKMLSTIINLKFRKSIYSDDCGVFYSFLSSDSDPTKGVLNGFIQFDYNCVKNVRYNGECDACLSVLSGQLTLITETNRQKRIETGYELTIPHHTSYQLRNLSVETCYVYFQVSGYVSA